jgi:ribonuclease T2
MRGRAVGSPPGATATRLSGALGLAAMLLATGAFPAAAEVRLDGRFVAGQACAAKPSIRRDANPGRVVTEIGRSYDMLAGNTEPPTHFLIRVPGAQPERRWVAAGCGVHVASSDGAPPSAPADPPAGRADRGQDGAFMAASRVEHVLAASWQPGFCETRPDKVECRTQTPDRFDASHFALHGLWPQPRSNVYCRVPPDVAAADKAGRWDRLAAIELEPATRAELETVMPGTASRLDRHEWIKHGTCYGGTMEDYFADSLTVMRDLNASAVRDLFAANLGRTVTSAQIRAAFDDAFGRGAGARVRVSCVTDPSNGRRLIGELTIGLAGAIDPGTRLSDLILAAAPAPDAGCPRGIVDAAGFQ